MHRVWKICWGVRAICYSAVLGGFRFPGYLGPPMFMLGLGRMFFGRRVRVFPGLRAECHGEGRLMVGDDVAIGQGFHVTAMGPISIGSGTLITGYVSITDIEHEYAAIDVPILQQASTWKETRIGRNCFLGMGARIQAGTILGDGCIVGANAVVRGEFPPYSVIVGAPGRVVKRYSPESGTWQRMVSAHSNESSA
ncbi:acyltransferase [Stenotrophomonas lactitubi]|uniref:acyltransferase n=1 Tax=Stenotrophomonas lactitubi TaxID=2045214 RepID=UPI003D165104